MSARLILLASGLFATWVSSSNLLGQQYISPCGEDCQQRVDQKFNAAKQLERQHQFEAAAQMFAAVIAEEPLSIISQDSALRAGRALENAGRFADALPYYDTVISIATARASEQSRAKAATLQAHKREALFQRVVALEQVGNASAATEAREQAILDLFTELAAEVPSAGMHQENAFNLQFLALNVAKYLEDHEDLDRAIEAYNHIIAISDARVDTADGENLRRMQNAKRDALLKKAALCQVHGCTVEALQAIQRVHEEFPASSHSRIVEAKLNNGSIAQAEFLATREQQVRAMLEQAFQALTPEARIAGADQVIATFPDTATSLLAMDRKARLLDDSERVEEAETAYISLLDRLRPTASRSEMFKSTRVRLKSLMAKTIATQLYADQPPPEQRWDQFRAVCNEIISQDTRPEEAAWAWVSLAESYAWQKRYEESLNLAEQFLAQHDATQFPGQSFDVRFIAGISAKETHRFDLSLTHLRWITGQPSHDTMTYDGKRLLVHAYRAIFDVLAQSGASPEVVSQAKEELNAKRPLVNLEPID